MKRIPEPSLLLKLFNGYNHLEDKLEDWGAEGPIICGFENVQITYLTHLKLLSKGNTPFFIPLIDGHGIFYDWVYYGDFLLIPVIEDSLHFISGDWMIPKACCKNISNLKESDFIS